MIKIAKLEGYKLIRHPMFWGVFCFAMIFSGLLFYRLCVDYLHLSQQALQHKELLISISSEIIKPICSWNIAILAIIIPIFTTYAFSQEYKQRTFYLFASSPESATSILMGKYLSLILITLILMGYILLMMLVLQTQTSLQWGMIAMGALSILCVGSCFTSFGLFISTIISHPMLAIGVSFLGNVIWMMLEWLNPFPSYWVSLSQHLSLLGHSYHLLNGIFYSPDIAYYLLFNLFWLSLTQTALKFKLQSVSI